MIGLSRTTGAITSEILLLVKDSDATNPDPVKDQRGCYKRGDVVEVLTPNKHDGNLVANPIAAPWWLLRVVGIPKAVAEKYQGVGFDGETPNRRRLYGIVYANLPAAIQTALTNQRYAAIPWGVLRLAMRNKVTLATEP
jgi:hypothetical protein